MCELIVTLLPIKDLDGPSNIISARVKRIRRKTISSYSPNTLVLVLTLLPVYYPWCYQETDLDSVVTVERVTGVGREDEENIWTWEEGWQSEVWSGPGYHS